MRKKSFRDKKIVVAVSGGVDSAVTAALLKKQGYDVLGAYIHFFDGPKDMKAAKRAKNIVKRLGVKFFEIDARKDFRKKIINYFIQAYASGLTPNPCVICNKGMKFGLLFDLMKRQKADYVATGHYARIKHKIKERYSYELFEAKDKAKDQSYFLYRLTQKDLARIIFPLGEYKKTEVKKIAKKFNLPLPGDGESQDVCFLSGEDMNSFLKKRIKTKIGNIVDEKGKALAKHRGLPFYTLGQRKGIEIGGTGPYFAAGKNLRRNELIVTNDPGKLFARKIMINRANWTGEAIKTPMRAKVQIRYHSEKVSAIIKKEKKGRYSVETAKPLRAPAPGQSAVLYDNSKVLGGGIIL